MDVRRGLLILSLFALSACGDGEINDSSFVQSKSLACAAAEIKNEYLVQWNSGYISKVIAESAQELIDETIEPNRGLIDFVEPNYKLMPQPLSSELTAQNFEEEAFVSDNWGAANIGAPAAWSQGHKGQGIIVAVLDSGVDVNHPDLVNQIAYNTGEIPNNGIDEDGNGHVDDYAGFNFINNTGDVITNSHHGTHVAGIVAAEHNDNVIETNKVQGVAPQAKILPIKFLDEKDGGGTDDAIEGINYAVDRGAKIINASWGGPGCSFSLELRLEQLSDDGVLFIAASGNEGLNVDVIARSPASLVEPAIITVGSINSASYASYFSNFGVLSVDLFAPGSGIYSTFPNASYQRESGTSMAAPFVSGAAAVLWSKKPTATAAEIKQSLLESVASAPSDAGNYLNNTQGRLDLTQALQSL